MVAPLPAAADQVFLYPRGGRGVMPVTPKDKGPEGVAARPCEAIRLDWCASSANGRGKCKRGKCVLAVQVAAAADPEQGKG